MLSEWAAFSELVKAFAEGEACLRVAGLTGSARALVVAGLVRAHPRPLLIVVVATPAALDVPLPSPTEFREATLRFTTGDSLDRELLVEALEKAGYERTDTVVEVGQWSVRGGIVDVFSPA